MSERFFGILDDLAGRSRNFPVFHFALAGCVFRVCAKTEPLAQLLAAALRDRVVPATRPADVTIFAWDMEPSPVSWACPEWKVVERWSRREPVRASDGTGMFFFDPIGGMVSLYGRGRRQAGVWFRDAATLPIWIAAAPFLRVLDSWFTARGKMLCHGAAIAKHGVAALIVGPGGAGKSTLALRSLDAGFGYLGDDYVLLEPATPLPIVYSVYGSGKLVASDLEAGSPAEAAVFQEPADRTEKSFLRVEGSSIFDSAPLAAVFEPSIGDGEWPKLEATSSGGALRCILPSALRQLPGEEQGKLSILTRVVTVPCYRLHLSRDHARNLAAIDAELQVQARRLGLSQ
ncbi:MAG: hypothetical protein ABI584_11975 [Acidobacteriota bacterium]